MSHRRALVPTLSLLWTLVTLVPVTLSAQIVPTAIGGLDITPDGGTAVQVLLGSSATYTFWAQNSLTTSGTWSFACSKTGGVTCGSVVPTSATIAAGGGREIDVTFTATAAGTARITLTATPSGETGFINVTVQALGPPSAIVLRSQARDHVSRGLCLTAGAGEAAGISCGDLFVVHAMPAYRSLGRDRSPTLLYNSATARGLTLVAAEVKQGATISTPNRMIAVLTIGTSKDSADFNPPSPGQTGQIALGRNLSTQATGVYPFTLLLRNYYSALSMRDTTITGQALVVNRAGSEYGQGWSLAGVEQLLMPAADTTQRVWVAGDGSIRLYQRGVPLTASMLSQSGLGGFSATAAVDGSTSVTAWQTNTAVSGAWAKVDLGTFPQAVTTVRVFASAPQAAVYDVEYSDNGTSWKKAFVGFRLAGGAWSRAEWKSVGIHRYWRLLLANTPGSGGSVTELSFGNSLHFYGAPGSAPDSLERFDTLATKWYRRNLKHGVRVSFDQNGAHRQTRNRVGALTTFVWTTVVGKPRLDSIVVPPNDLVRRAYKFKWNTTTARLDTIIDPGGRRLAARMSADSLLLRLRDPGGDTTRFVYQNGQMVKRIVIRKGLPGDSAITIFGYTNGARLTSVAIPTDTTGTTYGTMVLTPWDERGLPTTSLNPTAPVSDALGLPTRIDGALSGTGDAADIWVDGFGAPRRRVGLGLSDTTEIFRDSSVTLPGLVTRVRYHNRRWAIMAWNARGNLVSVRDSTRAADGLATKATTYAYMNATVPDSPTHVRDSITGAAARESQYTYTSQGLTQDATDPRGHTTSFVYGSSLNNVGLVTQVIERQVETWVDSAGFTADDAFATQDQIQQYTYDANGDLQNSTAPTGVLTSYVADALGRVVESNDPLGLRQHWAYDSLNRVVRHSRLTGQFVPSGQNCRASQTLCIDLTSPFTPALGDSVSTFYTYEPAGLRTISDGLKGTRRYFYTGSGALYREEDELGASRRAHYNAAGLLIRNIARTGDTLRFSYDAIGRRIGAAYSVHEVRYGIGGAIVENVPGDSISFRWDVMGNMIADSNRIAKVLRTYNGDGTIATENSLGSFSDLVSYVYDRTGARTRQTRTYNGLTDVIDYTYANTTGELQSMTVTWGPPANVARTLTFQWDALGRRKQITYPNGTSPGIVAKYRYDAAGILRRLVSTNPASLPSRTDRFDFTYRVDSLDAKSQVLSEKSTCPTVVAPDNDPTGSACGSGQSLRLSHRYNRFGMLVSQSDGIPETYQYDASGNMIFRQKGSASGHHFKIASLGNTLQRDSVAGVSSSGVKGFSYDLSGARVYDSVAGSLTTIYYTDGMGRATGIRDFAHNGSNRNDCVQYDPDGNMVVPCDDRQNYLRYEGANVVATMPTRWVFASGPGIDDPLMALWRETAGVQDTTEWFWVTDGRGRQFAAGTANGTINSSDLLQYKEFGGSYAGTSGQSHTFATTRFESPAVPGFSFFRNRVYDQGTGRWTQEDPLGVAGGLNLYQFNQNNPVAYTDPFGLCGRERGNCLQGEEAYKPDPQGKFLGVTGPTGGGGVGVALPAALAPVGKVAEAAEPDAYGVYAGPVVASFARDVVTVSGSPSVGTLGVGASWTIGEAPTGQVSGAVGRLFGQGVMGGAALNSNGSVTVSVVVGYNIPGGLGNVFGRVARFFSGSVSQSYR